MREDKKWVRLIDTENNSLIRIVYNPFNKSLPDIINYWIPEKYRNFVKAEYDV